MRRPKVCVLRTAGTNCDRETAFAFLKVGAGVDSIHINSIIKNSLSLEAYQILALPGGFSYGDDIAAGKILANELRYKLQDELREFIDDGKLIIGICNGFQILVKAGLLPGNEALRQEASLIINDSGKFEDRWVYLRSVVSRKSSVVSKCIWTKNLPEIIYLPVAHGEGKFIAKDKLVLERLKRNKQIVFRYSDAQGSLSGYPDNPNGSTEHIAGICDETGRILGMMPHPERHISTFQHPRWSAKKLKKEGDGLQVFKNGVEYAQKFL
ncbi:MAG TPA: phosphoribosylformylglycinamidine synthase I [Candidatus Omnitrophota bacterium]|nr:phosphoribosylformylglycinamidine synthase I [Candidatus Omnitrophota bacterium]